MSASSATRIGGSAAGPSALEGRILRVGAELEGRQPLARPRLELAQPPLHPLLRFRRSRASPPPSGRARGARRPGRPRRAPRPSRLRARGTRAPSGGRGCASSSAPAPRDGRRGHRRTASGRRRRRRRRARACRPGGSVERQARRSSPCLNVYSGSGYRRSSRMMSARRRIDRSPSTSALSDTCSSRRSRKLRPIRAAVCASLRASGGRRSMRASRRLSSAGVRMRACVTVGAHVSPRRKSVLSTKALRSSSR